MNYLTQAALLERGWTRKMIDTLLPAPTLKQNPYYRSAPPTKLWSLQDVERAEQTQEFAAAAERAKKRKASAEQAVRTKRQNTEYAMLNAADHIRVEVIPLSELRNKTLAQKQRWYDDHDKIEADAWRAPDETVNRWMVNYIRHRLTTYDDVLYCVKGKVGANAIHPRYKNIVLRKIAEAYPALKDECDRQESMT